MSNENQKHYAYDKNIEMEITGISLRDKYRDRENLNLQLQGVRKEDKEHYVYVRLYLITDTLNGAYESVCTASPKFAVETGNLSAKQARHFIHKRLREDEDPWNMIGKRVLARIAKGREHPNGGNYPDIVYVNEFLSDIPDEEHEELLNATDFFAKTDAQVETAEQVLDS